MTLQDKGQNMSLSPETIALIDAAHCRLLDRLKPCEQKAMKAYNDGDMKGFRQAMCEATDAYVLYHHELDKLGVDATFDGYKLRK